MNRIALLRGLVASLIVCFISVLGAQDRGVDATKEAQIPDTGSGWPGSLTIPLGHGAQINSLGYSPDGKYLATASEDKTVKLWDTETGRELWTFSSAIEQFRILKYSPDGKYIATGTSEDTIVVIDAATGTRTVSFKNQNRVRDMAYSPDGCFLYVTNNTDCDVFAAASGKLARQIKVFEGEERVESFAISPDGKKLVAGSNAGKIVIVDALSGAGIKTLSGAHQKYVTSVCCSPDGECFASGGYFSDHDVKIWNFNGDLLNAIDSFQSQIQSMSFSPDGTYLAMIDDRANYRLYNAKSKSVERVNEVEELLGTAESLSFSPDGRFAAMAGFNRIAVIKDVASDKTTAILSGCAGEVQSVAYRPDGKKLAIGSDDCIHFWDPVSGVPEKSISKDSRTLAIKYVQGGNGLFADYGCNKFEYVNIGTGDAVSIGKNSDGLFAVDSGAAFCVSAYYTDIAFIDFRNGKVRSIAKPFGDCSVYSLAMNPAGTMVAAGDLPDFGDKGKVKIWTNTGDQIAAIDGFEEGVTALEFSSDGQCLFILQGFGILKTWNVKDEKIETIVDVRKDVPDIPFEDQIGGVTFKTDPNEKLVAIGNQSGLILLFDMQDAAHSHQVLSGHKGRINSLAFSPDGTRLVSVSNDGTVKIWDTATSKCLVTMLHAKNDEWLAWTEEGYYTGSEWAAKNLPYFVRGREALSLGGMYDVLYRPDLVAAKLGGKNISEGMHDDSEDSRLR